MWGDGVLVHKGKVTGGAGVNYILELCTIAYDVRTFHCLKSVPSWVSFVAETSFAQVQWALELCAEAEQINFPLTMFEIKEEMT